MGLDDSANKEYLRTKVLTASPEELMLMLYDGGIKFAEQAGDALRDNKFDRAHECLVRAQSIVLELSSSLNHQIDPDLCGKMASLYGFVYRKLVEANLSRDEKALADALRILQFQRETWVMLLDKLAEDRSGQTDSSEVAPEGSLSVSV